MKFVKDTLVFDNDNQNLEFTGERYIPSEISEEMTIEHIQRYLFAKEFVNNKVILDAASGEGYGSHMLNEVAKQVYAIDLDEKSINEAQKKYNKDNIEFCVSSIEKLPFKDGKFDAVVSFETIEHVKEEIQQSFLKEVSRTLKDDGIFIISTPNKRIYTDEVKCKNSYHEKEFYKKEFLDFLTKYFKYTYVFNQHFRLGYFLEQEQKDSLIKLDPIDSEDARYYVVICSHNELTIDVPKSYEVFNNSMYFELTRNCNKLNEEICILNNDFNNFRHESKQYTNHLERDIKQLNEAIANKGNVIQELHKVIANRDKDIEDLKLSIDLMRDENCKLKEIAKNPISNKVKEMIRKTK